MTLTGTVPGPEPALGPPRLIGQSVAQRWLQGGRSNERYNSPSGVAVNQRLKLLLEAVADGSLSIEAALGDLRHLPYEDLGFAKVDHHRELRDAMPEVI